jgi:hypothetical protein
MSVVEDRKETDEGMTVEVDAMTVGIKTETSKVDALNEMTEVAVTTAAVAIGNVQNVKIQTSHSVPNATDAVNPKDTAEVVDEATTVEVDAMTVEAVETTEVTEADAVEKSTPITTGNVRNVKTQTLHSEPNATGAVNLAEVAEVVDEAMTEEVAETTEVEVVTAVTRVETDKVDASREEEPVVTKTVAMAIGTVPNVKTQISHSEPNATDAVHLAEAEAAGTVDLVETLEIDPHNAIRVTDLHAENFQNDHREERVTDLHAEMDATVAMSEEVRTEVRTIKVALEAMTVLRSANHVNLEPLENLEETARAMPITGLLNH